MKRGKILTEKGQQNEKIFYDMFYTFVTCYTNIINGGK